MPSGLSRSSVPVCHASADLFLVSRAVSRKTLLRVMIVALCSARIYGVATKERDKIIVQSGAKR